MLARVTLVTYSDTDAGSSMRRDGFILGEVTGPANEQEVFVTVLVGAPGSWYERNIGIEISRYETRFKAINNV